MTTHILYHGPQCCDGFAAALAAWLKFGDEGVCPSCAQQGFTKCQDGGVKYHPMGYGSDMPEIEDGDVVYMLDYSRSPEELQVLGERCDVIVIDHHDSAVRRIEAWEREAIHLSTEQLSAMGIADWEMSFKTVLDTSKSGAVLAWEHFHPGKPLPALFAYVQDRDLWRWELEDSRAVNARLATLPKEFDLWGLYLDEPIESIARDGEAVITAYERQLESLIEKVRVIRPGVGTAEAADYTRHQCLTSPWYETTIGLVNSPVLQSELGHRALDAHPDVDVAAVWYEDADGRIKTSLRSRKGGVNVARIAEQYGGGGHPSAAGFRTDERWW